MERVESESKQAESQLGFHLYGYGLTVFLGGSEPPLHQSYDGLLIKAKA